MKFRFSLVKGTRILKGVCLYIYNTQLILPECIFRVNTITIPIFLLFSLIVSVMITLILICYAINARKDNVTLCQLNALQVEEKLSCVTCD
jgi:hypothetical protein